MPAKVVYTAKGSDPAAILWPPAGPPAERFLLQSGQPAVLPNLIGYGNGTITYPDGRVFPPVSSQGSTFVHQKG